MFRAAHEFHAVDRPANFVSFRRHSKQSRRRPQSMTTERYNSREAEPRWRKVWDEQGIFATANADPRPKYYVLEMFPYPSGRIHICLLYTSDAADE